MSFRCSDAARERLDPMIGTAPPQRRWLLVEHPGPWPVSAPFDSGLSRPLLQRLGHPDLRVVLIRRFGRRPTPEVRSWALGEPGRPLRWGTWREPRHLLDAIDFEPRGDLRANPVLLVCTHGVHDLCCAVRGRPVAEALTARWPDLTWECSHLGGDRFAANLMVLPDGACYGALDATTAVATVHDHLSGRLVPARLRGIAGQRPAEQLAVAAVHDRFGPAPVDAAQPSGTQATGDGWRVTVEGINPLPARTLVDVVARRRPTQQLTCRTTRETAALAYDVVGLTVVR
ncbi:MAG: sucrase ferredoxin [Propionibacteriaceae bacterium]